MAVRRLGLALLLLLVVLAPAAQAKTIGVDWREEKTLTGGGALRFRVTKIVATTQSWAVTATFTNDSGSRVGIAPKGRPFQFPPPTPLWSNGMALIEHHRVFSVNIGGYHGEWWQHPATSFRPALPTSLAPHALWTGTFGGRGKLKKGQAFSLGFGLFELQSPESGGATVYWITDHSFIL